MTDYATGFDDFYQTFLRLEQDLDLFQLKIGGYRVWERERDNVGYKLLGDLGYTGPFEKYQMTARDHVRAGYLLLRNLAMRNPFLADSPELLFLGHPRRKRVDSSWWDVYCDPIHDTDEFDYLHLEAPWRVGHKRPARTKNIRYTDLIVLLGGLIRELGIDVYEFTRDERETIERIESGFESAFSIDVDLQTRFHDSINRHIVRKKLYDRLLNVIDPKLAVVVAHSRDETFIDSCHDAGVPVAELQHGQIGPYSFEYSFPGDRTKYGFPDYLLTFGDVWRTTAAYPIDDSRVIPVGYPFLERKAEHYSRAQRTDSVLFISTPESGSELSKIAAELSKRSDVSRDIIYKLHPSEYDDWQTAYPWLRDTPVSVVDENDRTLYELMATSSVQVGVGSTALYEGIAFDLATYLVRLPTIEWSAPLIENGEATLVESADELASHLAGDVARPDASQEYFKPNALENVSEVLHRLRENATLARDTRS
ncbi:hypothetical protein [Salinigranum sp. GCM10025319]|uniref:hypothetical protein n=1 Tax=Salinigranum sp. GCM10025319 TaxID=3252687 RepID=UPI0036212786